MKNRYVHKLALLLFSFNLLLSTVFSQAPQKMSYQAVVRNNSDDLVTNQQVGMQISILQGSSNGVAVYVETQSPGTNANGLVSLEIGAGTVVTGTFASIEWANGPYFIKTETDVNGGTNYTISGTSELMSVPYALFSANGTPGPNGPALNQIIYWDGSSWVTLNPGVDGQVLSICGGNLGWTTIAGLCAPLEGAIESLNCDGSTNSGTLTSGTAASGVSSAVPYTGGNGGTHNGQTVTSTGVTGLTATLIAGTFANGSGILTYSISGTPLNSGTASFLLNIGGQSCTLNRSVGASGPSYPPGTVHCNPDNPTAIVEVTNPITGRIWMDRNLGASQVATSSTDADSYGDLYQWGRGADGHQCRNSPTTNTLSSRDQPGHGSFIISTSGANFDWRSPQNTNLWQGVNGVNNPCPSGFRLPTEEELNAERLSWSSNNAAGAFASPLKWPMAGLRSGATGSISSVGTFGDYWSGTFSSNSALSNVLYFMGNNAGALTDYRAFGLSVRCIKD